MLGCRVKDSILLLHWPPTPHALKHNHHACWFCPCHRVGLTLPLAQSIQLTLTSRGTGYIGSFTALALLEADYEVIIVDNLRNSSVETVNRIELICGKRPHFYDVDITEPGALDKVFEAHPAIDSVTHFAALKVWQEAVDVSTSWQRICLAV